VRTAALQVYETLKASSRKLGPYVLLELLLPGGTLFALALFLYRRQSTLATDVARGVGAMRRTWRRVRASILRAPLVRASMRRARVVQMAECGACQRAANVAVPGRRARSCARAPGVRRSTTWRLPLSIPARCPALPPPA
jgi:hypothetical protein